MDWLKAVDSARAALVTGGLKQVERILGSAPLLGSRLPVPAPAKADPVLLVGGYSNHDGSWASWIRSLAKDGIRSFAVTVPGNAMGDINEGAKFVAQQVEQIRKLTGARRVDVVGFSAGGLIARQAARSHAARDSIDAVVTLATPNNGIGRRVPGQDWLDKGNRILFGAAAPQMVRGSAFLAKLNDPAAKDSAGSRVRYGSVFSAHIDGAVTSAAARLAGATNVAIGGERNLLQMPIGPDHYTILQRSNAAFDAVRGILLLR